MPADLQASTVLSSSALMRLAQQLEDDCDVLHQIEADTKREVALRTAVHYLRQAADPDYRLGVKL